MRVSGLLVVFALSTVLFLQRAHGEDKPNLLVESTKSVVWEIAKTAGQIPAGPSLGLTALEMMTMDQSMYMDTCQGLQALLRGRDLIDPDVWANEPVNELRGKDLYSVYKAMLDKGMVPLPDHVAVGNATSGVLIRDWRMEKLPANIQSQIKALQVIAKSPKRKEIIIVLAEKAKKRLAEKNLGKPQIIAAKGKVTQRLRLLLGKCGHPSRDKGNPVRPVIIDITHPDRGQGFGSVLPGDTITATITMDKDATGGKPFPIDRVCAKILGSDGVRRSERNWYIGLGPEGLYPLVSTSYKVNAAKDKGFLTIRCYRDNFANGRWGGRVIHERKITIGNQTNTTIPAQTKPGTTKQKTADQILIFQ